MAHSTEKLIHSDFKPSILHLNLLKCIRHASKCTASNVSNRGERCRCSTFCPSLGRGIWKQWSVQYNRPRQLHSLPLSSSKNQEKKNKGGVSFSHPSAILLLVQNFEGTREFFPGLIGFQRSKAQESLKGAITLRLSSHSQPMNGL